MTSAYTLHPSDFDDAWRTGHSTDGLFDIQVKSYDEPSERGIDGGRLSKLVIKRATDGWGSPVVSYDGGWDVEPSGDVVALYAAIVAQEN